MFSKAGQIFVFGVACLLIVAALTACDLVTPIPPTPYNPPLPVTVTPAAKPTSPPATATPVSGTATEVTKTIDGVAYTGLKEWSSLILDRRLEYPLFVAYTQLSQWRPIARASAARGTTYGVDHLDAAVGGVFLSAPGRKGRVLVNATILDEPIDVQAAVLAHELFHSQSSPGQTAAACVSEEMHAMDWEAYAYTTIIRPDGIETDWTRGEDARADLWHQNRLQESVLLSEDYQRECLGGVVK